MYYVFAFKAISKSNDNRLYLYDYDHIGQNSNIVNTTIDIHIHLFRLVSEYIDFDQVERLKDSLNALYEHDKIVNRINLETVNIDNLISHDDCRELHLSHIYDDMFLYNWYYDLSYIANNYLSKSCLPAIKFVNGKLTIYTYYNTAKRKQNVIMTELTNYIVTCPTWYKTNPDYTYSVLTPLEIAIMTKAQYQELTMKNFN